MNPSRNVSSILVIVFLAWTSFGFSQTKTTPKDPVKKDPQNMQVTTSREPFYPKGEQALYSEVLYGIKYTDEAKKKYMEGEVTLSFDVKADSSVSNVKIISDAGYGTGEEVKGFVEKLKFAPAIQMGRAVKMKIIMSFPVKAH